MKKLAIIFTASILGLTGCANAPMNMQQGFEVNQNAQYGKLLNVREYGMQRTDSNPVAMAGGAIVGGLLGNQVGGGRGKKLATIAGAAAGAYAANEMVKAPQVIPMVELNIRDDNGQTYTINQEKNANYYPGQRVRVVIRGNVGKVTPY
jgi:outer membrane lipoprotein SlyB